MKLREGQRYEPPVDRGQVWFAEAGETLLANESAPRVRVFLVGDGGSVDGVLVGVDQMPVEMGEGAYAWSLEVADTSERRSIPCRDIAAVMPLVQPIP